MTVDDVHNIKVLQLGKFYPILGGVEKVEHDLMTGLSAHGIDCDMLCALTSGGSKTLEVNDHARIIGCRTWLKAKATMISPSMVLKLRRICSQYDIIHVHHPDPMACLALFLSGYKGRVVLHWHSDIERQRQLLKLYKPLQQWLIRRADVIVGTTPVYTAESPHLEGVRHKVVCLPIGITPMVQDEQRAAEIRQRYQGRKIVFTLGRLVPYKGYGYLVSAASYLSDDYVVLIGGCGDGHDNLQQAIDGMGVGEKVKLLGRVDDEDLPAYYGACDVFCLSSVSKTEAFGIVQLEAMSLGKPIVATTIPHSGVSWVNAHDVSGLNVPPRNAKALADAITAITADSDTYQRLAHGARRRFDSLFTLDRMIAGAVDIYSKLMNDNGQ